MKSNLKKCVDEKILLPVETPACVQALAVKLWTAQKRWCGALVWSRAGSEVLSCLGV